MTSKNKIKNNKAMYEIRTIFRNLSSFKMFQFMLYMIIKKSNLDPRAFSLTESLVLVSEKRQIHCPGIEVERKGYLKYICM